MIAKLGFYLIAAFLAGLGTIGWYGAINAGNPQLVLIGGFFFALAIGVVMVPLYSDSRS